MKIEIKNRFSDEVIYTGEHETLRDAVCSAIANRADLRDADLRRADLRRADLSGANLSGADLSGADLSKTIMPGFPSEEPPASLAEAAERTKDWLKAGHWVQQKWICTPDGAYAGTCLACLHGAAVYVGGAFGVELSEKLSNAGYTEGWNDEKGRTIADIEAALDEVAK